jgi:hypothetical protein
MFVQYKYEYNCQGTNETSGLPAGAGGTLAPGR